MKVTVKINKRNLTGLINKTSFKYSGGMFTSYGFIAITFDAKKNNTAKFYESVQVNRNSWTNYPGFKIWDNNNKDWRSTIWQAWPFIRPNGRQTTGITNKTITFTTMKPFKIEFTQKTINSKSLWIHSLYSNNLFTLKNY